MIQAYPKKHLIAALSISAIMTLILLLSPSPEVEAKRTSIDIAIQSNDFSSDINTLALSPQANDLNQPKATEPEILAPPKEPEISWLTFKIKQGDTLSSLFKKGGLDNNVMYKVLGKGNRNKELTRIFPGEEIAFDIDQDTQKLNQVKLIRNKLEQVIFSRDENGTFISEKQVRTPDVSTAYREATIESSLFLAGQKANMSQAQIMELANIFGWDIDFVLDIRKGDHFNLVYEELFLDGEKYKNGNILAASFTNQGRTIEALRYEHEDGSSSYYSPEGKSMRKAFLRTPVDFARISSHFNLKRKHPVLHKIRAHRGTDYAAARGTPIRASGDGKVIHAGRKGGYGKTVIIQHGQKFTTLYAHMSKYAKGIRSGKRVKQGQVIGYIGSTGLASGPHLHYEFRVNGIHKNPVKVKLPQAEPINKKELARFKGQTEALLAQLYTYRDSYQIALNE